MSILSGYCGPVLVGVVALTVALPAWAGGARLPADPALPDPGPSQAAPAKAADPANATEAEPAKATAAEQPKPAEGGQTTAAEAPKTSPARAKLVIVPDAVMAAARRTHFIIAGGPRSTSVEGNEKRYRKYSYIEPSNAFVLNSVRAFGGDSDYKFLYDVEAKTPFEVDHGYRADFMGFDSPTHFWVRDHSYSFFREYGSTAQPSRRTDTQAGIRLRPSERSWIEAYYRTMTLENPAGTTHPQSFATKDAGIKASWRMGGVWAEASASGSQYFDHTAALTRTHQPVTPDRTSVVYSLKAASANHAEVQWHGGVTARQATYTTLGDARYLSWVAGGGLTFQASKDVSLASGLSRTSTPKTITQNTYRPNVTAFKLSGLYTGWRYFRGQAGYERRDGTRWSLRPTGLATAEAFTERQTTERWWLGGRLRNLSKFTVDCMLEGRELSGSITDYLNRNPYPVPILFYPHQTRFDLSTSYPAHFGLVKGVLRLGQARHPDGDGAVRNWGFTGLWSRGWSGRWLTSVQYDRDQYRRSAGAATTLDTDLSSLIASAGWGLKRASLYAFYGVYTSGGGFAARHTIWRFTANYQAGRRTNAYLDYQNVSETETGPWVYSGRTVSLGLSHDF